MTRADGKPRKLLQSLAAKTFMALAAASLPAIAVTIILGLTLVAKVSEAETDFNRANSATIELNEMLVLIEKERGLFSASPANSISAEWMVTPGKSRPLSSSSRPN